MKDKETKPVFGCAVHKKVEPGATCAGCQWAGLGYFGDSALYGQQIDCRKYLDQRILSASSPACPDFVEIVVPYKGA